MSLVAQSRPYLIKLYYTLKIEDKLSFYLLYNHCKLYRMAFILSFRVKQHLTLQAIAEGMIHIHSHFSIGYFWNVLKQLQNKRIQIYCKRSLLQLNIKIFFKIFL